MYSNQTKQRMEANNFTYLLTVTTANYTQGILNIPTRFGELFGPHGSQVTVLIEDRKPIILTIDRNNVANNAPRTSSHLLRDYFQEQAQMGHSYQVSLAANEVRLRLQR